MFFFWEKNTCANFFGIKKKQIFFQLFEIGNNLFIFRTSGKTRYVFFSRLVSKGVFFSQDMFEALAFLIERYDDLAQGGATREDRTDGFFSQ